MNVIAPQIKVMEYLLVLNLPPEIAKRIKALKNLVYLQCGSYRSRYSEPHISLFRFLSDPLHITGIREILREAAVQRSSFQLHLDGIDFFPNPENGVAYVKVKEEDWVRKLNQWLRAHVANMGKVPKSHIANSDKAHLTIARGLTDEQLLLAQKVLKDHTIRASFLVDKVVLLHREPGTRYQLLEEFSLGE